MTSRNSMIIIRLIYYDTTRSYYCVVIICKLQCTTCSHWRFLPKTIRIYYFFFLAFFFYLFRQQLNAEEHVTLLLLYIHNVTITARATVFYFYGFGNRPEFRTDYIHERSSGMLRVNSVHVL